MVGFWRSLSGAVQMLARLVPSAKVHQRNTLCVVLFGRLKRRYRRASDSLLANAHMNLRPITQFLARTFQNAFQRLLGALELLLLKMLQTLLVELQLGLFGWRVGVRRNNDLSLGSLHRL